MASGPGCPGPAEAGLEAVGAGDCSFRTHSISLQLLLPRSGPALSTMKGTRAISSAPECSPAGVDLSLTGLPPPVSRRPGSAATTKPIVRSVSVVTGSEQKRKALVSTVA